MQFAILIYGNEAAMMAMTEAEKATMHGAYMAYSEALVAAGVMRGGERLKPSPTAASVRIVAGKSEVLNGPYAETREQLGGFYLIDVADMDQALAWGARCPGASHGTIEVRPIWTM